MSQKAEKPVLSGQRIKTRKRDEKEKFDPHGFRDAVVAGLDACTGDFDAIIKYLDTAGGKLNYRRYGEVLFDVLIAGGLLLPGGLISEDGDGPFKTDACIFASPAEINVELMKTWEQVFIKLTRRYKYLEKIFQEEIQKILLMIKYFTAENRQKLSVMTSLWLFNGAVPFTCLLTLNNPHLIKDNLALDFIIDTFKWWREERGVASLHSVIRKSGFESHLLSFVPDNKQSQTYFRNKFMENGLEDILKLHDDQHQQLAKKQLQQVLLDSLNQSKSIKDIVVELKDTAQRDNIQEHEIVCIIWNTVMSIPEWSKKEELVADQAIRQLKPYSALFSAFTTQARSELSLILKVQDFCYSNMTFMRSFQKIILLFYKTDVVSEPVILKWYRQDAAVKGKMVFLEQMSAFVDWLQDAEEESDTESESDE